MRDFSLLTVLGATPQSGRRSRPGVLPMSVSWIKAASRGIPGSDRWHPEARPRVVPVCCSAEFAGHRSNRGTDKPSRARTVSSPCPHLAGGRRPRLRRSWLKTSRHSPVSHFPDKSVKTRSSRGSEERSHKPPGSYRREAGPERPHVPCTVEIDLFSWVRPYENPLERRVRLRSPPMELEWDEVRTEVGSSFRSSVRRLWPRAASQAALETADPVASSLVESDSGP